MAHGNHWSVQKYKGEVPRRTMVEVAMGRAMIFKVEDAERIQGVVKEKENNRVVHH